jgi:zinc finger FYVE domain-containing protein 1
MANDLRVDVFETAEDSGWPGLPDDFALSTQGSSNSDFFDSLGVNVPSSSHDGSAMGFHMFDECSTTLRPQSHPPVKPRTLVDSTPELVDMPSMRLPRCESSNPFDLPLPEVSNAETRPSFDVTHERTSSNLVDAFESILLGEPAATQGSCLQLLDSEEKLLPDWEEFQSKLRSDPARKVKVCAVFGNTGDGKSHTLNHVFFDGAAVFDTSDKQSACTVGAWAALHHPSEEVATLVIDTEGMLAATNNENIRIRLLLKILAICDVVLFCTKAERLHNDLFAFLDKASAAYLDFFADELQHAADDIKMKIANLGPTVVIFHETYNTEPLGPDYFDDLAARFPATKGLPQAFYGLHYIGTRRNGVTDFTTLQTKLSDVLSDTCVRIARPLRAVWLQLEALSAKFNGQVKRDVSATFPSDFFTCQARCTCCKIQCTLPINHPPKHGSGCWGLGGHKASTEKCVRVRTGENQVHTCRSCYDKGIESRVNCRWASSDETGGLLLLAKKLWRGDVWECANCGVILSTGQQWWGNDTEFYKAIRVENRHIFIEDLTGANTSQSVYVARRLGEVVGSVASTVSAASEKPLEAVTQWMAPSYWQPDYGVAQCKSCGCNFNLKVLKHHCRVCGFIFCHDCSPHKRPVPFRGWKTPVRVCKECFTKCQTDDFDPLDALVTPLHDEDVDDAIDQQVDVSVGPEGRESLELVPRKVGEVLSQTAGTIRSAARGPCQIVTDWIAPDYWQKDEDITSCNCCHILLGDSERKHHCRACGKGVCATCSPWKHRVPSKGWMNEVRVCNICHDHPETF